MFRIICALSLLLATACNKEEERISYCYFENEEGRIGEVICDNISREECIAKNSSRSAGQWFFDKGEVCPITEPPIP